MAARPRHVCIYCSSSAAVDRAHVVVARDLGAALAARGDVVVWGGATVGLMGEVARAARAAGGRTIGVIPEALQAVVYEVGRRHFPDTSGKSKSPDGRPGVAQTWFATIYQILLGEERGPRFGSFVALYGVAETRALIARALAGELLREHEAFVAERARPAAE